MKKFSLLLLALVVFSSPASAKYIYEYLDKIELLLKANKFDEANAAFKELSPRVQDYRTESGSMWSIYEKTVKWLKTNNDIKLFLVRVNENPSSYKAVEDYGISTKDCYGRNCESYDRNMITSGLPNTLPFSPEFFEYVIGFRKENYELFVSSNNKLHQIAENKKKREADAREAERK